MLRWLIAAPFILLWGCISISYIVAMIGVWKSKKNKSFSMIPLIGGLSGVIGLAILDWHLAIYWFWVPLLLDFGSLPLLFITLCYWLTGEMARAGYIYEIPKGDLTDAEDSSLYPWNAEDERNLGWLIPFNFRCWGLTAFARRVDMNELAAVNKKGEVITLHYQTGNRTFADFTGRFPNYKAWKSQILKTNGRSEYLSPDEFLIHEEAGSNTCEDWQSLCLWMLEHGNSDSLVIDVAANGMEDWQSRKEDTDRIRKEIGYLNMTEQSKLRRIEQTRIEKYKAGEIGLEELISRMDALWQRHSDNEDLTIWFALYESLGYYDNGKGTLIHKLNPQNPLKSAEMILRKHGKL